MAHDIVIKHGTIVDGSGRDRFVGDVAIEDGVIVAVGEVHGTADRVIDADGLVVTPGFVDIHTHYDGQATWDGELQPSAGHGVTSVLMGNCGVGFAPARPGDAAHEFLISLMEGVEDIPGTALAEGLPWNWESFPSYLDALDREPKTMDIGAYMPHAALRAYVMGSRGADHLEAPTDAEIEAMSALTYEALMAGAMGFSTSRTANHRTRDGEPIGSLHSDRVELLGITEALRRAGRGVIQMVSDFEDVDAEVGLMVELARASGRPLTTTVAQVARAPQRWRDVLGRLERASAEGLDMSAQVCLRPTGLLLGLETSMSPFMTCPTFVASEALPLVERVAHLRDPAVRARILDEHETVTAENVTGQVVSSFQRLFRLGATPDYEPPEDRSLAAEARRIGADPRAVAYDALLEDDGHALLYFPLGNYVDFNLDAAREMFLSPIAVPGLSDGGAHVGVICDASFPTYHLTHWTRDRTRGEVLPLERVVYAQTRRSASVVGWHDRGELRPGLKADVNVIDLDALSLARPRIVRDLPAGGRRLLQDATGYVATICSGVQTFDQGRPTGERPGRIVRGARPAPAA